MVWPEDLAAAFLAYQQGRSVDKAMKAVFEDPRTFGPPASDDRHFPLQEMRSGGWKNSERGREVLQQLSGPWTVVDSLCWEDLALLPDSGSLLFLGDGLGGFSAVPTRSEDGAIPCARCLVLRYLGGRAATPRLFQALRHGCRVAFERAEDPIPTGKEGLTLHGKDAHSAIRAVLPLPDCQSCLKLSRADEFSPGPFSPVRKVVSSGPNHGAYLPEMVWLAGEPTVGSGGCYDLEPERGVRRAVHEALERYAAHFTPATASAEGILFQSASGLRLFSRKQTLLTEPGSVSTGLACQKSLPEAISHALAEVCERDALARFWLDCQQGGCRLARLRAWSSDGLEGDLYQLESYHLPTFLCLARTPSGQVVTGSAAGPAEEALDKAAFECLQNASYFRSRPDFVAQDPPETFADHAGLYWTCCRDFPDLARYLQATAPVRPLPAPVYHCELTPADLALLGYHVVRVLVPGLLHLPMSHRDWPDILQEMGWPPPGPQLAPHPFS
jgi:hypothetical protein